MRYYSQAPVLESEPRYLGQRRHKIEIVTDADYTPPASPVYSSRRSRHYTEISDRGRSESPPTSPIMTRQRSFSRERRESRVNIVSRSPEGYSPAAPSAPPRRRNTVINNIQVHEDDTQDLLARFYHQQAVGHREQVRREQRYLPAPSSSQSYRSHSRSDYRDLALVPTQSRELYRHDRAIIIDRNPEPPLKSILKNDRSKQVRFEPKIVEHKKTQYLRDTNGNWLRVKRVTKAR